MSTVMWVDPGETSGVTIMPIEWLWTGEWDPSRVLRSQISRSGDRITEMMTIRLLAMMAEHDVRVLGLESFVPNPRAVYTDQSWEPIKVIAMVEFALLGWSGVVVKQNPSEKALITDEMLDVFGVMSRPKTTRRHENDSTRHLIVWCRKVKGRAFDLESLLIVLRQDVERKEARRKKRNTRTVVRAGSKWRKR